uniref:Uncharacterized protein n=1 Tax=Mus musculus TaxID=10090 RepID=Q3V3Q6_MOUSE|nr:unnamed protein product [Mus musculus]
MVAAASREMSQVFAACLLLTLSLISTFHSLSLARLNCSVSSDRAQVSCECHSSPPLCPSSGSSAANRVHPGWFSLVSIHALFLLSPALHIPTGRT